MDNSYRKIYVPGCHAPLKVRTGHFATNHSHINYYIDMTTLRTRLSEAREVARYLAGIFAYNTYVDTIVCLDGIEMIGGFLAEELTQGGIMSMNQHKTIYVVTPEYNNNGQIILRDNIQPMIRDKNVILMAASVTTGLSVQKGIETVEYYGGMLQGITSIFSIIDELNGHKVISIFSKQEVPDYASYGYHSCPLCKQGKKLDALVNAFGYSKI